MQNRSGEKTPSIKVNMLMNVLLTLSSIIFPLITLPYVTRVLNPAGIGKVYFATSVITFFSMLAELGIPVYGIRACARARDDEIDLSRTVHEIVAINLVTCLITYIAFFTMILTVPKFSEDRLMITIMSSLIFLNAIGVEWLYKALEKYTYITIRSLVFKVIAVIGMFLLVRSSQDHMIYGCLTVFAASASNVLNFVNLRKHILLRPVGGYRFARHLPAMMMFFALAAATTIYTSLDLAILDFLKDDAEAGLYGVSVKIKLVIVSLVTSASAVLLPRNSYYYDKGQKNQFMEILSKTIMIVAAVSVPAAVYFVIFARDCIDLLAGSGFAGAVLPMQVIMPTVILIGISNVIGIQMLIPEGRERDVVISSVAGAIVDLVLNFILIPHFASAGAAAATLAAEFVVTGYLVYAAGKDALQILRTIPAARIIAACIAASAGGILAARLADGTFIRLCISSICFAVIYLIMTRSIWRPDEILHRN
ncbi:MAG: flippase [Mogibacterium sp.]|nr:flippase [Mogibacterium sp.]